MLPALRWLAAGLLCLAVMAPLSADDAKPAESKTVLDTLEFVDGDTVVFLGDSITHQRLYTQYVETYFYTRYPKTRIRFHNAGVGGARAWDALQRFDQDVAAYKPKYVFVLLGMNDGSYRAYDDAVFQTYMSDMRTLVDRITAIGATPILMSPTMFDSRAARKTRRGENPATEFYNSVLAYYGTWLREVAQEGGYGFIDMWSPLNNLTLRQRKAEPDFTLIKDAVHPGPDGQVVMATAIINDLGFYRNISTIVVDVNAEEEQRALVIGGELSDLKIQEGEVSFTWKADSLPWVLPADAQAGARLTNLGHRLSREALMVAGLAPGQYELIIDDVAVATYSSATLGRNVELQTNEATPQYQQALEVAMLNKQRNEGPVGKLRGEWLTFQAYARTKRSSSQEPNNEKLKGDFEKLDQQIQGIDERVARHNADAKVIEDQIYEANQPKPRRYVIRKTAVQP